VKKLIMEYKQSLRDLHKGKVKPLYLHSMISDTQWAISYMETGQIPGTKWSVARWSKEDREVLFDPHVMDKCFNLPAGPDEVSENVRKTVEQLLLTLAPRERQAFVLVHAQGFSYQEAADYMAISKGNVYNLIRRADKKFERLRGVVGRKQVKGEGIS